jgi:hypothetical protein
MLCNYLTKPLKPLLGRESAGSEEIILSNKVMRCPWAQAEASKEAVDAADAPKTQAFTKMALTWQVKKTQVIGGKTYVLMSHDYGTNGHVSDAYKGDTGTNQRRSLLCINKPETATPAPAGLTPLNVKTPGGAMSNSWSSAKMFAIPNILGSDLTSRAVADSKCNTVGQVIYGTGGYRMAEFHDGQAGTTPGWSYWTEGYSVRQGLDSSPMALYWVAINGQPANPW